MNEFGVMPSSFFLANLDNACNVMVRYTYDAWGGFNIVGSLASTLGTYNPFCYRGYYYDRETGLYYLHSRYYDPETGRFISQDSIEYAAPETINGLNLYAYCGNNPVMCVDPSGNFWNIFAGALIGALAGLAGQFIGDILSGEFSSWQSYVGAAVGGAVSGALVASGVGVVAAAVFGSVFGSVTTLTVNQATGQGIPTLDEIVYDVAEDAALSALFAVGGNILGNIFGGKVAPKLLTPIFKEAEKITIAVFLKNLSSELMDSAGEALFNNIIYNIRHFLNGVFNIC